MPLIEDAEYERLTKRLQEGEAAIPSKALIDMLGKNPKHRESLLRMMKDINPNLSIPEIDAAAPVMGKLDAFAKEFKDFKDQIQKEKDEAAAKAREASAGSEIDTGRKSLRQRGYTPEGIEKIEKLMETRGLVDYDAAAALFDKQTPPDKPIVPTSLSRAMPMVDNSASDDLKAAVSLPKMSRARDQALKRWTESQLQAGMQEIIQQRPFQRSSGF